MTMSYLKDYYRDNNVELKEEGKFLPLICYEVIIPEFVRKFAKAGAPDFIVNITNDKWARKDCRVLSAYGFGQTTFY